MARPAANPKKQRKDAKQAQAQQKADVTVAARPQPKEPPVQMIRMILWMGVLVYLLFGRRNRDPNEGGLATAALESLGFRDYVARVFGKAEFKADSDSDYASAGDYVATAEGVPAEEDDAGGGAGSAAAEAEIDEFADP
jgi:hypothetical protein